MSNKLKTLEQLLSSMSYDMSDNHFVFWNSSGTLHVSHSCEGPDGPSASVAIVRPDGKARLVFFNAGELTNLSTVRLSGTVLENEYLNEYYSNDYDRDIGQGALKEALKNEHNREQFEEWMTEKI